MARWQPKVLDPRTKEGELLWPQRMGEAEVKKLESALGPFGAAGQLQQRPAPRGGGIVSREDFLFYRLADLPALLARGDLFCISTDAAFKDTDTSSYVVVQTWMRIAPLNYLLKQTRERLSFGRTIDAIMEHRAAYPQVSSILIEDKANGPAIISVMQNKIAGVNAVEPIGSKPARAEAAAPLITAHNVVLPHPEEQPWVESFISEWCAVPTNAFWDQVDASDQYLLKYGRHAGFAHMEVIMSGELSTKGDGYLRSHDV